MNAPTVVIVAVIVSGVFIGINNTLTTTAVMLVAPVERPVASSAYGFMRFIGVHARTIAIGPSPRGPVAQFADGSFTSAVTHATTSPVMLVEPGKAPYRLTVANLHKRRSTNRRPQRCCGASRLALVI